MAEYKNLMKLHAEPVQDIWLDAYGHLNEAYYLVPFSNASWALQDHFQIGVDYFDQTGRALYTLESHVRYLREVRAPALMEIESLIIESDAKRYRFVHIMKVDGTERATFECLVLHYDTRAGKTAPMPDNVRAALREAAISEPPDWVGRSISLHKKQALSPAS